jgi:hypothetical protein
VEEGAATAMEVETTWFRWSGVVVGGDGCLFCEKGVDGFKPKNNGCFLLTLRAWLLKGNVLHWSIILEHIPTKIEGLNLNQKKHFVSSEHLHLKDTPFLWPRSLCR